MSPELISILALAVMFVIATIVRRHGQIVNANGLDRNAVFRQLLTVTCLV